MSFREIYSRQEPVLSFEFFPPRKAEKLPQTLELIRKLAGLNPALMTVTYGAGGGTRDLTEQIVCFIRNELHVPAVAHLTCVGHSEAEIDSIARALKDDGIEYILALRGDPPKGESKFTAHPEGFSCARDLVRHLNSNFPFSLAVAGYPETHREAASRESDLSYLREKVEAGAEVIVTQLFFELEHYTSFVEEARVCGITVPIVPGVMPISNVDQLERFTKMCGASIPARIGRRLATLRDDPREVIKYGSEEAIALCRGLIQAGAPGIHLYTLNKSQQVVNVATALREEGLIR